MNGSHRRAPLAHAVDRTRRAGPGRYLVTGGCGFIGSHVVEALVAAGHDVTVLDDLSSGDSRRIPPSADLVVGNVTDDDLVQRLLAPVDGCFHLAAVASVPVSETRIAEAHRVNIGGFVSVAAAAQRLPSRPPIVYASSAAVYGDCGCVASEDLPPGPISHYGCDKLACEQHARISSANGGVPSTGLRFFNVYGPRQDPSSPYSGVVSAFVSAVLEGRPLRIFGDGAQTRNFVFVRDAVGAMLAAMRMMTCARTSSPAGAAVFNVCTGESTSVAQLARAVFTALGRAPEISHEAGRPGDIRASAGSPRRAADLLGFRTATPLSKGIAATLSAGTFSECETMLRTAAPQCQGAA